MLCLLDSACSDGPPTLRPCERLLPVRRPAHTVPNLPNTNRGHTPRVPVSHGVSYKATVLLHLAVTVVEDVDALGV